MAKKNERDDRRAVAEKMRKEQQRRERARSLLILGSCVLLVLALLGFAGYKYWDDQREKSEASGTPLVELGVAASAAGCDPVKTTPTGESPQHVAAPTPVPYADAPPAFGSHRPAPAGLERQFYTAPDRPEVAQLVHNLEHGYTILWYADSVAGDGEQLESIEAIASKYDGDRFIAAPWTADDGAEFPTGKQIALTRWSADAANPGDESKHRGNWQYCEATSGVVVSDFFDQWPNKESPEPRM